jgi:hypothetical protein
MGFVKDEEITALLSKQYGVPSINLAQFDIDPGVVKLIPPDTAHKYQIVPLSRSGAWARATGVTQRTARVPHASIVRQMKPVTRPARRRKPFMIASSDRAREGLERQPPV